MIYSFRQSSTHFNPFQAISGRLGWPSASWADEVHTSCGRLDGWTNRNRNFLKTVLAMGNRLEMFKTVLKGLKYINKLHKRFTLKNENKMIHIEKPSLHVRWNGLERWYERPGGKAWLAKRQVSCSAFLWGRLRTRDLASSLPNQKSRVYSVLTVATCRLQAAKSASNMICKTRSFDFICRICSSQLLPAWALICLDILCSFFSDRSSAKHGETMWRKAKMNNKTAEVSCFAWSGRGGCGGVASGGVLPYTEHQGFIDVILGSQDLSQPAVVGQTWRRCLFEGSSFTGSAL